MNCLLGYNGIVFDRPVFSIGHFFKSLMFRVWSSPRELSRLLAPRQRLQICLGDSNMAEEAEYLRVATTMLVLDAIEAGYLARGSACQTANPLAAGNLRRPDDANQGSHERRQCRALRWKSNVSISMLARNSSPSQMIATDEAREILKRWTEALNLLELNPEALVGRLDWVTKRFLLRQTMEEGGQ